MRDPSIGVVIQRVEERLDQRFFTHAPSCPLPTVSTGENGSRYKRACEGEAVEPCTLVLVSIKMSQYHTANRISHRTM